MSYIDGASVTIEGFEGTIPWMYLDSLGNVTVGVGCLLSKVGDALLLPFIHGLDTSNSKASLDEITVEFNRVHAMQEAHIPGFYKNETNPLVLTTQTINGLLESAVVGCDAAMTRVFTNWKVFPDNVKMAVLDMDFNLGTTKLVQKFPQFVIAIKNQNWAVAAAQCHRIGISDARNEWTKAQLMLSV